MNTIRNPRINERWLNKGEFFTEITPKTAIMLHHTASGPTVDGDINWWNTDPRKIATAFIIDKSGNIFRTFNENLWAVHTSGGAAMDRRTIGIELTCWGQLTQKNGQFFNYLNRRVLLKPEEVVKLDWRGHSFWEDYSDAQIESLKWLLQELGKNHNIKIKQFVDERWFDVKKHSELTSGIISHSNVTIQKTDVFPSPKLIDMLNSL
jgi:N-acetyl-anhydromuramyl-L-alanine amidase AmpD